MIINLKLNKEIIYGLFFFVFSFVPNNFVYLVIGGIVCGLVLVVKNNYQIYREPYTLILFSIIFLGCVSGFLNQSFNMNYISDYLYFLAPAIWFFIGFQLFLTNSNLDLLKTFLFSIFFEAIYTHFRLVILFLNRQNLNFDNLRDVYIGVEFTAPLAFVILLSYMTYQGEKLFSSKFNNIFLLILSVRIFLSLSRTMYLLLAIYLVVFYLCKRTKQSVKVKSLFYGFIFISLCIIVVQLIPDEMKSTFFNKIVNSFKEVSSDTNWNIYRNIVHNWRGYETSVAKNLFASGTIYEKLFGFGFGQLIPVLYSNLVGVPVGNGGIIILHNGYATLLIKAGIVGVALYVSFFCYIIVTAIKTRNKYFIDKPLVISLGLCYLFTTFIVSGFFTRAIDPILIMLFSESLAKLRTQKSRSISEKEITYNT